MRKSKKKIFHCFYNFYRIGENRLKPVNSYWQIPENSSKNFSKISVFRDMTQTDLWKTHPFNFYDFWGMSFVKHCHE